MRDAVAIAPDGPVLVVSKARMTPVAIGDQRKRRGAAFNVQPRRTRDQPTLLRASRQLRALTGSPRDRETAFGLESV